MATPFTSAEPAAPRLHVHQQTFRFMNQQPVYIQITELDHSAWVWISSGASPLAQQINGGAGSGTDSRSEAVGKGESHGAFGDFAMAMPPFRPGQAAVSSTLLGNPLDETSASIARRLATKFKRQFLVNVDIPPGTDNAMLVAFAERKVLDMLKEMDASKSGSSTATIASETTAPSAS